MGEQAIEAAVAEVVEDAAEQAAEDVRTAAAIEQAAEAVEDAAERVEQAADDHAVAPYAGPSIEEIRQVVQAEVAAAMALASSGEPITHDHAVEVAETAAESAVETIVEAAQDAADDAGDDLLPDPSDVELPGDGAGEAVENVADVIDQAADEPPRKRHWFQRDLVGRR